MAEQLRKRSEIDDKYKWDLSHIYPTKEAWEEAFAALMTQKAIELGCTNTHFTNSSGLHEREHKTSAMDMALIMAAAMENEVCRRVLSTRE